MADQTNPQPVTIVPVSNITPAPQQPLACAARASFGPMGSIPSKPTPMTPVRRR